MKNTPGKEECYAHTSPEPGIKKCPSCTKYACCFLNSAVARLSPVCVKMGNSSQPGRDFFKSFKQKLEAKEKKTFLHERNLMGLPDLYYTALY